MTEDYVVGKDLPHPCVEGREGVSFRLPERHSASHRDIRRARRLRTEMTDAELRLWMRLRCEQIDGYRFRRQVPMGPYVVDLVCLKARLVIEVDGGQHAQQSARDDRRTAWLASQGFKVLRFWDNDVLHQTGGVVEVIRAALAETPSLPSPQGGGNTKCEPAP
jgi:very-short-patch-repair endonuclease